VRAHASIGTGARHGTDVNAVNAWNFLKLHRAAPRRAAPVSGRSDRDGTLGLARRRRLSLHQLVEGFHPCLQQPLPLSGWR
jgi:hypothetical protein